MLDLGQKSRATQHLRNGEALDEDRKGHNGERHADERIVFGKWLGCRKSEGEGKSPAQSSPEQDVAGKEVHCSHYASRVCE